MQILLPSDRQLLGDAGLTLDDDAYVQTIAGMGALRVTHAPHADGPEHFIGWSSYNFQLHLGDLERSKPLDYLLQFRKKWLSHIENLPEVRVMIEANNFDHEPDSASIARILSHPAARASTVFLQKQLSQADLRWQWPLRISAFEEDLETLNLQYLTQIWPADSLVEVNIISRELARSEILVIQGSIRAALRRILTVSYQIRTGHIILIGPVDIAWRDVKNNVDALLSETQAGALSLISCPFEHVAGNLNNFVEEVSHNTTYDHALALSFPRESSIHFLDFPLLAAATLTTAAHDLGQSLRALPRNATLSMQDGALSGANILWTPEEPISVLAHILEAETKTIEFSAESAGASGLKEIASAERNARYEAANEDVPRFLQSDLFMAGEGGPVPVKRGFVVGLRYQLNVFIGPTGEGSISAEEAFDETQLDWKKKRSYTLQVIFADPQQWDEPMVGTLVLPRKGKSSTCTFLISPTKPGPLAGRVTIYHRGRILQTAQLKATVFESNAAINDNGIKDEKLRFVVESEIHRGMGFLDERRRFDACMVLNRTTGNTPTATICGKHGAAIVSLKDAENNLSTISSLMNDVAYDAKRYAKGLMSKENAELLCNLAMEGHWLYRNLVLNYLYKSSASEGLRKAEYLQIVSTRPDEPIPLEFVYDYPPPIDNAPVCENALEALKTGHCPASCKPTKSPTKHVCPLGFWGLSRVIERHEIDPEFQGVAAVVKSEPLGERGFLHLDGNILVAVSNEIPAAARSRLIKKIKSIWSGDVVSVKKWDKWVDAISDKRPRILLTLPHAGGNGAHISLEISGKVLKSAFIDQSYVKADRTGSGPLVILFGCDTARVGDTESYTRHVTVFRQADAALVLGTVAVVLGEDAADVAAKIITQLVAIGENSTVRFGEALRQVKRDAVADSQLVAMCLAAFGDADWRLK